MNGTSSRGGAYGFNIDSLQKYYDTKSKDNKTTLIQYVIFYIIEELKEPEILDIVTYLNLFPKCKIIHYLFLVAKTMIDEGFKTINNAFLAVDKLKRAIEKSKDQLDEDDKSVDFLNGFYEHASKSIKLIEDKIASIDKDYVGIIKYFGEKNEKVYPLIEKFIPAMKTLNEQVMVRIFLLLIFILGCIKEV